MASSNLLSQGPEETALNGTVSKTSKYSEPEYLEKPGDYFDTIF